MPGFTGHDTRRNLTRETRSVVAKARIEFTLSAGFSGVSAVLDGF